MLIQNFIRKKKIKGKNYYYIIEAKLVNGKPKQKVLKYLGTAEALLKKLYTLEKLEKR